MQTLQHTEAHHMHSKSLNHLLALVEISWKFCIFRQHFFYNLYKLIKAGLRNVMEAANQVTQLGGGAAVDGIQIF
ncbi:hypothetical protein E2562_022674 [Oryza meyeriana var. granulata]|uniref:Uncharacterized protein n=1 Tax=Oryza meyeriana var. granulata TaxID=110450 RepID=A0A6G1E115_9ORYZ|nr:hypothetical protein E2562_022674 [Oryza meyeriana var. granulata]